MKDKTLKVFENHGMQVTAYYTVISYPYVEVVLQGRDGFPGEREMKEIAQEIGTDALRAECYTDSVSWSATVNSEKKLPAWMDTAAPELKRIYVGLLDVDYFRKCVEDSVDYTLNESDLSGKQLKKALKRLKRQVYGLRDVFWLFTSEDIVRIAEPVIQALEELG